MTMIRKLKEWCYKVWFAYHQIKFGQLVRKPCASCGKKNYYDISGLNVIEGTRFLCQVCFDKEEIENFVPEPLSSMPSEGELTNLHNGKEDTN